MDREPSSEARLRLSAENTEALDAAVDAANRWLARFAPLVRNVNAASASEARKRLTLLADLRETGPGILRDLDRLVTGGESELASTLRMALSQMEGLETDYRRHLAALAPGDPRGVVDLTTLQEDLAALAARREVEQVTGEPVVAAELNLETSPTNVGAAAGMGLFSFGWLSFTTFHAAMMIGGMYHAFGLAALALLGFYSIFFGVGFAMAWAAWQSAVRERIVLRGRSLTVHRSILFWEWENRFDLASDSRARLEESSFGTNQNRRPNRMIVLRAADGRSLRLGRGASADTQRRSVAQINEYLSAAR